MDFDQMLDAWKAQDEAPLYGVNEDLLRLVLQNEQAVMRRSLRWELWTSCLVGTGMVLWTGFWLWVLIYLGGPPLQIGAAALGTGVLALWAGGFVLSRSRQRRRERAFGETLHAELRRHLSLVEYQLARFGTWSAAALWTAPLLLGSGLLAWLMFEINHDPGESRWEQASLWFTLVPMAIILPLASSRAVTKKLAPRREHLRRLLATLDAGE